MCVSGNYANGEVLVAGHDHAHYRDAEVVEGEVVDEGGLVGQARELVAVVPPRRDARPDRRVHSQPLVGVLSKLR